MTTCHKGAWSRCSRRLARGSRLWWDDPLTDVVPFTHDSFAVSDAVKEEFERDTGLKLRILKAGDAGEVVTKAALTAGNPQGDVLFGVDNTLLSRALDGDVFEPYESAALENVDPGWSSIPTIASLLSITARSASTTTRRFAERGIEPPSTLEEVTLERYHGLLVVENPATSSPGLAFLLATVARLRRSWQGYWRKLRANGVLVVDGWEEAYTVRFSGAAGSKGNRPIVVSYSSSPVAEVIFRSPRPAERADSGHRGKLLGRSSSWSPARCAGTRRAGAS